MRRTKDLSADRQAVGRVQQFRGQGAGGRLTTTP